MRIERLELENFRLFEKKTFHFPALFTVLIGENGRGKSALLHGLRVAAGAWLLGFREVADQAGIEPEDVRRVEQDYGFRPQFPTRVEATGRVGFQLIFWAIQRKDFKAGTRRAGLVNAKLLVARAEEYDKAINDKMLNVSLPVLVFFSTARLRVDAKKNVALKSKGFKIQDGYFQALTPDYKRKSPFGRAVALAWIKTAYLKQLEGYTWPRTDFNPLSPEASPIVSSALLEAVLQAIMTCVPDWTELRWDLESDDLAGFYQRSELVPLYYLSDGLRTMAGMVAEIAYRCVTLNGHLGKDAVTGSKGLVLIDELDMHLHPNWQRRVVSDLKKAFPNLQFVVTTHSPFIVQSLETAEIISLDDDDLGGQSPKELPVGEVAVDIMNVESELSQEGEKNQNAADDHLALLQTAQQVAAGRIDAVTSQKLEELEASVSDVSLRMTLRMERILREHPAPKSSDETN